MKIYTKKGDAGETDLLYQRVKKNDLKMEVVGTVDELISFISYANSLNTDKRIKEELLLIRKDLSSLMHEVVSKKVVKITTERVNNIEAIIDNYQSTLKELTDFIYFEDNIKSASLNICRTVTRRLERLIVDLKEKEEIQENCLKYVNRLSDLLFMMARYVNEVD